MDSTKLVFLPMTYNSIDATNPANAQFKFAIDTHSKYWAEMADSNTTFLNVDPLAIDSMYYMDACHLTSEGNGIKATIVAKLLEPIIWAQKP